MSTSAETSPAQVEIDTDAQTLSVEWADGHTSVFPLDGLRRACPCAHCIGHGGSKPGPDVFDAPAEREWTRVRARTVGGYALRLAWDDGHDTGIYRWKYLRALCPCTQCRS